MKYLVSFCEKITLQTLKLQYLRQNVQSRKKNPSNYISWITFDSNINDFRSHTWYKLLGRKMRLLVWFNVTMSHITNVTNVTIISAAVQLLFCCWRSLYVYKSAWEENECFFQSWKRTAKPILIWLRIAQTAKKAFIQCF